MGNFPDFVASVRLSGSVPSPFQVSNDHRWPSLPRSCKNSHKTRKHSSRMRTPRSSPYGGVSVQRPPWTETPPPVNSQTRVKIVPCSKLRLRAVKMAIQGCCVSWTPPPPISFLDPLISQVKRNRLHVDVHKINNSLCSGIL